jgi:hypothetical protein
MISNSSTVRLVLFIEASADAPNALNRYQEVNMEWSIVPILRTASAKDSSCIISVFRNTHFRNLAVKRIFHESSESRPWNLARITMLTL